MNYEETLEYIHSVSNYFCKPGLDRIKKLCAYLGNPQDKLKFVHVAGTNGKGSFCALLSEILIQSGLKVGTYTSPYILEFNERIQINGQFIPNKDLCEICKKLKEYCDTLTEDKPTEFELITAIAFEYFYRNNCDIVVLECGLGGKFDATNIIKTTALSVVTGIDFDHQNFLGNTIEEIASEKAGIIKESVPCLWCGENNVAESIIKNVAIKENSLLYFPKRDSLKIVSQSLDGTVFNYSELSNVKLNLLGDYQPYNAINAIEAAFILKKLGYNITNNAIIHGIHNGKWRARFEILSNQPLIIFDGAHNPQGVKAAVGSIKKYFKDQQVCVLTGVMRDKNYLELANEISKVAKKVFCVAPNNARSLNADEYASVYKNLNIDSCSFVELNTALNKAISFCKKTKTPLICMGSLYMYADIYNYLNKKDL